jgi:hypothetical protein
MIKKFILLLIPFYVCFADFEFSISPFYRHDKIRLNIEGIDTTNIQQAKLSINNINSINAAISASYIKEAIFLSSNISLGKGKSSNFQTFMQVSPFNYSSYVSSHNFKNKINEHNFSIDGKVGYPICYGPFSFIPIIGFSYDMQSLHTKNITEYTYIDDNVSSTYYPKKHTEMKWYTPLIGAQFSLSSIKNVILTTIYEYHLGSLHLNTSFITNVEADISSNLTEHMKSSPFVSGHFLSLKGAYIINQKFILSIFFNYRYFLAKEKSVTATLQGSQVEEDITTTVNESLNKKCSKNKWESFASGLELGVMF